MNNDFMVKAACRNHPNPDMWFSPSPRERAAAEAICAVCPVAAACGDWAVEKESTDGIWSGQLLLKKPKSHRTYKHGTDSGWKRHRRLGEVPCASCVQGHQRAGQERWAR